MAANGREKIQAYDRLKAARGNFDERWDRMAPYLSPSRVGITGGYAPGDKQSRGVFDSTGMLAAELHAMFVAGHIINPSQQWFNYMPHGFRTKAPNQLNEWLEECRDRTLRRLSTSMFYAEGPEALVDWGGFGTGCLLVEEMPQPFNDTVEGFRGFHFTAVRTGRFCVSEGPRGLVDTLYRDWQLEARVISDLWGHHGRLPENVKKALTEGKGDKLFKVVHGIYPRAKAETGPTYLGSRMPWASCWIEAESKEVLYEGGYKTFPAAVPRYHRTPGEVYGRGRGDLAFPDIWTLNTAKRMGLEDWALKIRPPILHRHDSVIGSLRLVPGGPTSINTHGAPIGDAIVPFQTGSHPEVSQINEENLRKSIENIFYVRQILALLEVQKSEMTAYEFARKIELLFRLLGPVYGRLEWEWLYVLLDICFTIQYDARDFSPPPPQIQETDGSIDIEFQNPIAKAQRSGDAEALTMALTDIAPYLQATQKQEVLDRLDGDKAFDGILDLRGVPASWQRSDEAMAMLREERLKQQQEEQKMAQLEQAATAIGKAGPGAKAAKEAGIMPGSGSPL